MTTASIVERLQKRLGAEAVSTTASGSGFAGDVVHTGSLGLDVALGIGGLPLGRVVEIYGPESSGKTTLTLHILANAMKAGLPVGFIDAEHALDMSYAQHLGVDPEQLMLAQPDTGEAGLNMAEAMIDEGVRVIVIDSVSALTPKAEIEGDIGDHHVGLQARMMGQALRKLCAKVKKRGCLLIFINQIRMKIGVMFGSPETTSGGNALKFYASVRIDIRNIGKIKKDGKLYGHRCRLKTVKNKLSPPFQEVEVDLIWGEGFQMEAQLLDVGVELEIIEKAGSWFSFGGERLGQGRAKVIAALTEDQTTRDTIEDMIREELADR